MPRYSFEFKKKVVREYMNGEGGTRTLAQKHNLPNRRTLEVWIAAYKEFGDEGLLRSRKNSEYTFEFKLHVVELHLTTEVSYLELALSVGIKNPAIITNWVSVYRIAGPDALRPKKKGRKPKVAKPKKEQIPQAEEEKAEAEYLRQLEEENLKIKNRERLFKRIEETAFGGRGKERQARIIHSLRGTFKLKDLLAVLDFPKSTYMYWQKRFDRENSDKALEKEILEIRKENKDFGYRRIHGELTTNRNIHVNKKKVQRIVQKLGLQVTSFTHKSRKYSSYKGKVGKVAPNRINRRFNTHIPHQKITTDTTEFKYYHVNEKGKMTIKKLYLDPFMDMCNSEIISYGISQHPSAENIMKVLNEAIEITKDCPYRRTFHSDQGWAYQMKTYVHTLKENKIFQSMSRKGNCHDNSVMENFFGIMKQEMYYGKVYYSFDELKNAIEKYIKYYNEKRIKQKLGWLSPVNYRLNLLAA